VLLRLLAPVLPFVTEEAWSWWQDGSVHRARWPEPGEVGSGAAASRSDAAASTGTAGHGDERADGAGLAAASAAIGAIRKAKSQARLAMRATVARLVVTGPADQLDALAAVLGDVRAAGHVAEVEMCASDEAELRYQVTF
jgi:valyl-tRNA synthetase